MTAPTPPAQPPPDSQTLAGAILASSEKTVTGLTQELSDAHTSHAFSLVVGLVFAVIVVALFAKSSGDAANEARLWKAKADTAVTAVAYWKVAEWRARDSMRRHLAADSIASAKVVRYAAPRVIHDTRVVHDTVPPLADAVPLPAPPPGQPLVLASAYDAQTRACQRERADCAAALAASDSAKKHLQQLAFDRQDEAKAATKQYNACERRDLRDKIIFGVGGIIVGYGVGAAHP